MNDLFVLLIDPCHALQINDWLFNFDKSKRESMAQSTKQLRMLELFEI